MPISVDEWDAGNIPSQLKAEILAFLQASSLAYTSDEIMNHLLQFQREPWGEFLGLLGSMEILDDVLLELSEAGDIESKMINREWSSPVRYYRATV